MQKAYDTILSDYVDASTAAKNGGSEPYRYECACCWEEVHICAADSHNKSVHFRHRSGNNDVECENYLGNRSAIIHSANSRRNIQDKIEFYFFSTTKMFSAGIKFNTEEIMAYEQSESTFQVRKTFDEEPFISIPIDGYRFLPGVTEFIPLHKFSWTYFVSSANGSKRRKYEVFRKNGHNIMYPSFFKIQADGDYNNFRAKLVRTDILYTNISYFMVFPHQYNTICFNKDARVDKVVKFNTMGRDFSGVIVTFINKTDIIEQQLASWNYRLETNEMLTLLWPPSMQIDDTKIINTKYAYTYSSFEMQAHGNVNVHSNDIVSVGKGVSKITVNDQVKVFKRNSELLLIYHEFSKKKYDSFSIKQETSKNYVVSDNSTYLFSPLGVSLIAKGTSVSLSATCEVRHYLYGYLDRIVTNTRKTTLPDVECILQDILMYYRKEEIFDQSDFDSIILSQIALQYIESCKETRKINSAAKHFIMEGKI